MEKNVMPLAIATELKAYETGVEACDLIIGLSSHLTRDELALIESFKSFAKEGVKKIFDSEMTRIGIIETKELN